MVALVFIGHGFSSHNLVEVHVCRYRQPVVLFQKNHHLEFLLDSVTLWINFPRIDVVFGYEIRLVAWFPLALYGLAWQRVTV